MSHADAAVVFLLSSCPPFNCTHALSHFRAGKPDQRDPNNISITERAAGHITLPWSSPA